MRIYLTHCSDKKDNSLRNTGKKVTPDDLYTAPLTKCFMSKCKQKNVNWAIFSDLYGVWFPEDKKEWYNKDPYTIIKGKALLDPEKFRELVDDFDQKLQGYSEIWFYHNPGRFHPLYRKLLQEETRLRDKIKLFTHIKEIV